MPGTGDPFHVTIACGGTGGHMFPGLAVAEQLAQRGASVDLMVSPKEVDQLAAKTAPGLTVVTLPAVGLTRNQVIPFLRGFIRSYRSARAWFSQHRPQAALAMGGFTSAPPLLAARRFKAATFLHESNSIPGRANRWLSWLVDGALVGFPAAAERLHTRAVTVTGTPVRSKFRPRDAQACRAALGLHPSRPMALVMGGSQGARGVNELVMRALPSLASRRPDWQWFHLAGPENPEALRKAYAAAGLSATVHSFFVEMELAMGGADACISRAGASSLAEIAAMQLPSLLIPFPAATDDHQLHNAKAFCRSGAARMLDQHTARPQELAELFFALMNDGLQREQMKLALAAWHTPRAAEEIAQIILQTVEKRALGDASPRTGTASRRDLPLLELFRGSRCSWRGAVGNGRRWTRQLPRSSRMKNGGVA